MSKLTGRAKSPRSPGPLRTPTTPSHFFPPSYFAAAAGVPYPRDDLGTPSQQLENRLCQDSFSSNAASYRNLAAEPSNPNRSLKRRSQLDDLCLMEPHLLPTLNDTIERMTRPPSQVISSSPFHPIPGANNSPSLVRTPSTSSHSTIRSELRTVSAQTPTMSGKQSFHRSPSNAQPEQPPSNARPSSSRSNPKSILKSHAASDQHLQVRQPHLEDPRTPTDHTRKPGPTPELLPPLAERGTEHARPAVISPRPKIDASLRTGRARSRTDPGTLPKGLPSTHGRNTQPHNLPPSGIPRRAGMPSSPATPRVSTVAQTIHNGPELASVNSTQREKRRLFVTNAEITSSSSSECQVPLTRFLKSKTLLSRTDSQSSAEGPSQLRPPRFGLGLGLSGVDESKKLSPRQRWTTKMSSDESLLRYPNSPSNKRHQRDGTPKRRDRSPSKNTRIDSEDVQRRQRELLSLMRADFSSGCDSQPSGSDGSEHRCLASDGSGESIRSRFDDSRSDYSPVEESGDAMPRKFSRRRESKFDSNAAARQSRINLPGGVNGGVYSTSLLWPSSYVLSEFSTREDEQYTPKASSIPAYSRQKKGQSRSYPTGTARDEETESSTLASDEDTNSMEEPVAQAVDGRYSSELARIMATSMAAAARQRQAFGISSSPDLEDCKSGSSNLPHVDSDVSLIGGNKWHDECDELATGSLLQRWNQNQTGRTDGREYDSQRSSSGELSISSTQTPSSVSQESIYSLPGSPTTLPSGASIVIPDSPPPVVSSVHDQQWKSLERYILETYGEVEARRQQFVWELTDSEVGFVAQLQNMVQLFILPLRVRDTRAWVSGVPSDIAKLFDWLDDIVRVHAQLSSNLTSRQIVDHPRLQFISEVLRNFVPRLEIYQPYLVKLEFTASVIDGLVNEGRCDFGDFIKLQEASERCQGWSLEKYLIEPVNRLAQYPEMFRRLLQLTPKSHPDYLSTLSLFHSAKLTIRVLSEVKDREDTYEFVKMACSGIKGVSSMSLAHRERRLLVRGQLTCVQVSNDEPAAFALDGGPLGDDPTATPRLSDAPPGRRVRRADRLSKAVHVWRGRSNSVKSTKSTASTVASFSTAPSSFDVHAVPPAFPALSSTPVVRVESEPVQVEVLVFSDVVLLATRASGLSGHREGDDTSNEDIPCEWEVLEGFGLSRIVSVLDEIGADGRGCITLDLAPLTPRELEEGYVQSTGPVVTIALSLPPPLPARRSVSGAPGRNDDSGRMPGQGSASASASPPTPTPTPTPTSTPVPLADWLAPLSQCCRYTRRVLSSSLGTAHHTLVNRAATTTTPARSATLTTTTTTTTDGAVAARQHQHQSQKQPQKQIQALLAVGLPLPKSPSMQMDACEMGLGGDVEQEEREERGWWSKRFHEVFAELSEREPAGGPWW